MEKEGDKGGQERMKALERGRERGKRGRHIKHTHTHIQERNRETNRKRERERRRERGVCERREGKPMVAFTSNGYSE